MSVFVAGASGYIGGRLVPCLLERGYRVRCLARSPKKLEARGWASEPRIEIVGADLADTDRLVEHATAVGRRITWRTRCWLGTRIPRAATGSL